jgi:hypothetical protein
MTERNNEEVSDEMLMALADGELDSAQAAALRARIARDPELAQRLAVFTETAAALRAAFAQGEVPPRLIAAVEAAEVDRQPEDRKVVAFPSRSTLWPMALAASLALGVGLGWGLKGTNAPMSAPSLAEVAQAVSGVPTGETAEVARLGAARVLGSFETERGLCRLIAVEPDEGGRGRFVACRDVEGWDVALSLSDGSTAGYAPASAMGTEMIDLYLDAVGAGAALDAETEAAMLGGDPE